MGNALEDRIRCLLDGFPARSAVFCANLKSGAHLAEIGADTQVVSASTVKVAVLLCALTEVMEGRLSLDGFVPMDAADHCDDTAVFEPGYRQDGASLGELLYWMIVSSDNSATNAVLSLLTFGRINSFCRSIGLEKTEVQRKMLDFEAVAQGRNNYTSPRDQYRMYQLLFDGAILTPPLREVALDYLSRCRHFDGLQRYLPQKVTVAHKPGGLDHLNHDAGIFLLEDRPYFLGVFTWDGPAMDGEPQQNRLIGQISRITFDYITKGILL